MANIFELQERRVIPNWRTFLTTVRLGELNNVVEVKDLPKLNIQSYVEYWKIDKSIINAGELLSAAVVNNFVTDAYVIEASNFIIKNKHLASKSQVLLAKKILYNNGNNGENDLIDTDLIDIIIEKKPIYNKIHLLKKHINHFPRNAIAYVEIARLYSILGQTWQADNYLKKAYFISPNNRFVLRAISRHFAKTDIEFAHNILRKNYLTKFDPWLASAEIALATIRNRNSRFIKQGLYLINSNNFNPFHLTELSSSIGTVELINGSYKKGKKLFNTSLIAPNDNSLAQL